MSQKIYKVFILAGIMDPDDPKGAGLLLHIGNRKTYVCNSEGTLGPAPTLYTMCGQSQQPQPDGDMQTWGFDPSGVRV